MRHLEFEEVQAVSGAGCGDLTVTVGFTGISISGSTRNWLSCFSQVGDTVNGVLVSFTSGIPYGMPHVA